MPRLKVVWVAHILVLTFPAIPSHLAGGQPCVSLGCDEALGDASGFIALEAAYPGEHKVPAPVKQCQAL